MRAAADTVFPLIPLRRSRAFEVAGRASRHRGAGDEIATTRSYRRGDAIRSIDWAASARLSTARGSDEFVVRDHFAEDVVRVVVVVDRSPSMAIFEPGLPWLHKPAAVREAVAMIVASGVAASALLGFAEANGQGVRFDRPARDQAMRGIAGHRVLAGEMDGPADSVERALKLLLRSRSAGLPAGTFVFVVSDFLSPPSQLTLRAIEATGWDLVPVVVQDPVWERSFPDISGVTVPLADPYGDGRVLVRLSRREARARREANERRALELDDLFRALRIVVVHAPAADRRTLHAAFIAWAGARERQTRNSR